MMESLCLIQFEGLLNPLSSLLPLEGRHVHLEGVRCNQEAHLLGNYPHKEQKISIARNMEILACNEIK